MRGNSEKYRIIACDMDGTLLNSEGEIPKENIEAVRLCGEKGVTFVLCTGRPVQAVLPFREILGLETPVISYNGSRIVDPKSGEVLYQECMAEESVCRVLDLVEEYGAVSCVWADDALYFNKMTPLAEHYVKVARVEAVIFDSKDRDYFRGKSVNKLLWAHPAARTVEILESIFPKVPKDVSCFTSSPEYIEFVSCNVSKGEALRKLCENLGVPMSESVALGDGDNDIKMIEAAGLGIAMGNGTYGAKAAADKITVTNDECGVARAIYDYVI